MKTRILFCAVATLALTGCWTARIVSYSPTGYTSYLPSTVVVPASSAVTTTVTIPRSTTTTTTTKVTAVSRDISLCLDLQAVGAAFAQASTVEEFERILNDNAYNISNLDLNSDGYVDYLRVLETVQGVAHVFVIQAVLADNVFQDVATLVAEVPATYTTTATVQIIGAPYIYGPNYVIEPVFYAVPAIYPHLVRTYYSPWRSPWYWGHFPPHYHHPAPIFISHYHACIDAYMRGHRYCHEYHYAHSCHYPAYVTVSAPVCRNDYAVQHPEREFSRRTADIPVQSRTAQGTSRIATNARDIRESVNASRAAATSVTTSRSAAASSRSATTSSSTRTSSRSAATTTSPAVSTSSRSAATSGSTTTTSRSAATTTSRSAATSGSTTTTSRSAATTSSRPQTTIRSSVSSSGSNNTRISTVSSSGSRSSYTRSSAPSSVSSRSSSSSSSSVSRSVSSSPSRSSATSSSSSRSSGSVSRSAASSSSSRR